MMNRLSKKGGKSRKVRSFVLGEAYSFQSVPWIAVPLFLSFVFFALPLRVSDLTHVERKRQKQTRRKLKE